MVCRIRGQRTVCQGIVSNVVAGREAKVEEQGGDAGRLVVQSDVEGGLHALKRNGHGAEARAHETGGKHVHVAALEAGDVEGDEGAVDETPAGVGQVDARLGVGGGVAHHAEEDAGVVAEQRVARQLGEEADEEGDVEAATQPVRGHQLHPRLLGHLHLRLDGLADLGHLGLDEQRVPVALGVVLDQDGAGLLVAVLGHEVARRLGEQEDGADLEDRGADLEQRRDTPRPVALDVGGAEGDGRGENLADEVGRVEERRHDGTLLGMRQLTDQGGARDDAEEDAGAEDHAGNDVHGDVLGETLEERAEDHGERADHDGPPAAEPLSEPWGDGHGEDGSKLVARVDESEHARLDGEFGGLGGLDVGVQSSTAKDCAGLVRSYIAHGGGEPTYTGGTSGQTAAC